MKTWYIELLVITVVLTGVAAVINDPINWVTTFAVLLTFQHAQIGDRLQERQHVMDKPTVECYYKLNWLFGFKEICWIAAFILMKNYAAIIGSVLFAAYPLWRKYYRKKIKPLRRQDES